MGDLIDRQAALKELAVYIHLIDKTMGKGTLTDDDCMEAAKSVLGEDELPAVQPDHNADVSKKVEQTAETAQNVQSVDDALTLLDSIHSSGRMIYCDYCALHDAISSISVQTVNDDTISRNVAINALHAEIIKRRIANDNNDGMLDEFDTESVLRKLPSAQPEIIHCGECIYYDPPHVEKENARYEYSEMPKEAFDVLGTGLVSMEYGINIGGRCCVDYYCKNYSDDKRVYVRENNYCGRAERRTDG